MEQTIYSAKTGEVAALPYKMNLQLFSDDEIPSLEDDPEFEEVETKDPETVEPEQTNASEELETPEVVDPAEDKPVQDEKTNAAFADMRRKVEEAEKKAEIAKKYGQYGVASDAEVADKYGKSHGIFTLSQLDSAVAAEKKEQERQQWVEKGVDPDEIEQLIDSKLQNHPAVVQAREQAHQAAINAELSELKAAFPDVKADKIDDIFTLPNADQLIERINKGCTLKEAYELVNMDTIIQKRVEAAKQAATVKATSKNHIRPNGGVSGDLDTMEIPEETLRSYKALVPGKSMDEYRKHYRKSMKG